jgi:hypothetical protein
MSILLSISLNFLLFIFIDKLSKSNIKPPNFSFNIIFIISCSFSFSINLFILFSLILVKPYFGFPISLPRDFLYFID